MKRIMIILILGFGILLLVLIVLGFMSFSYVGTRTIEKCEVKEDCPDRACFTKKCSGGYCLYSSIPSCSGIPRVEDYPELKQVFIDLYAEYGYSVEETYFMQKGLEIYEKKPEPKDNSREALLYLASWETPKAVLEENIPEIRNYPKLEQVFIDLYAEQGFSKEENKFMQMDFKFYEENPKLEGYPRDVLLYLMSRTGVHAPFYDIEFFNQTLVPLAKEITAGAEDDLAAIKAISTWVNNNIAYDMSMESGHSNTPKDVLREKKGMCGEYSILIIGLSKAAGIPARYASARQLIHTGISHAWVEAYIAGDWIPIASTGALDFDNDLLIEYSELKTLGNNKMVDVLIRSPYSPGHNPTDITFGYNNYIVQQMITEVQDMLNENYNLEAENKLESAKNTFSLWEKEKSTEERNRIGREAMEDLLRAVAILKNDVTSDEVYVAFLGDFPEVTQSQDTFWVDFQETLVGTNPKVLYLFDGTYMRETWIDFTGGSQGIDFHTLRAINELIKNKELDTELNFVLYWLNVSGGRSVTVINDSVTYNSENDLEKIEFLDYNDIEPVITLISLFEGNALDFMWKFIGAVESVRGNVTKTDFYLPPKFEEEYDYYIAADGVANRNWNFSGWAINPGMDVETSIGELPLKLKVRGAPGSSLRTEMEGDVVRNIGTEYFPYYTNLIIVDEMGNVLGPDKDENGEYYYADCPSDINLDPGQNLIIEREGDFIKITETGK